MFELDETLQTVQSMVRQFCVQEIEPVVTQLEAGELLPYPVLRKLAATFQLESMLAAPRGKGSGPDSSEADDDSGAGAGATDPALAAIFAKELSRVSPGVCLCVAANFGCGTTIAAKGDAELRSRCAVPVLSLQKVGCWALTEPGSGSDAFAMRTTVRLEGGEVVLDGSKTFITNAPHADVFLIYARWVEGDDAGDKRRVFPIVVERGTPGLSTGPPMAKFGMHASPTGEIFLDQVRVPRSHLLGDPEVPARSVAEETLASERASIVAMCLGVIERCLEDATTYAMDRVQFGKPIAAFQLIQQKLARIYVAKQNVENLMFKLIWMQRNGKGTEREVSAAKWYATEAAAEVALDTMQLLGGAGYMREHAAERLFRDIKLWTIGGGTSEIQQLTIAKDLLRRRDFIIDLAGGYRDERR